MRLTSLQVLSSPCLSVAYKNVLGDVAAKNFRFVSVKAVHCYLRNSNLAASSLRHRIY